MLPYYLGNDNIRIRVKLTSKQVDKSTSKLHSSRD